MAAGLSLERAQNATRAAQGVLQSENPRLFVDGRWGTFTNAAYASSNPMLKQAVNGVVGSFGSAYTPEALFAFFKVPAPQAPASAEGRLVSVEKARALVERAYNKLGAQSVGIKLQDLQIVMWFEAARKQVNGETFFDAGARNSLGYTGLYQFNKSTWDSVASRSKIAELGSFSNAADPWLNTLAMVAYAILNVATLRGKGFKGDIDSRVIYGAHQQGAMGYLSFARTGRLMFPNQSQASIAFLTEGKLPSYAVA